jgi:UDP-N-acetylglucosamine 1-carboxyvinyltransferase
MMDKIEIVGGKKLAGEVRISGAKNAALPILTSSLLVEGWNIFHNIPDLMDIKTIKKLLKSLGVEMEGEEILRINAGGITSCEASYDQVRTMRASILVLGPLVARTGEARVSLPGGCAIGARPVNLHIKALRELGAEVTLNLFRYLHGHGDGKHHDGRDAGGRDHHSEKCGARAGDRQSG